MSKRFSNARLTLTALVGLLAGAVVLPSVRAQDPAAKPVESASAAIDDIVSPNDLLLFEPKRITLGYVLRDKTQAPLDAAYSAELRDWSGKSLRHVTGQVTLGAGRTQVPIALDLRGLRYGPYTLEFRLTRPGASPAEAPLAARLSYISVSDLTPPAKARPGEFLYGADIQFGVPPPDSRLYHWVDYMGVDILRGGINADNPTPEEVARQVALHRSKGLQFMPVYWIPWVADPAERERVIAQKCATAEDLARRFPEITYWELGNEPDLTGFYGGPIEDYAQDYERIARAIKRGNLHAVVANGGLCFAGDEAVTRARRFVQVVDPATINAWAYHAHGPLVGAERGGYLRMLQTTQEFGKSDKPFIGTESGLAARGQDQEVNQARTAIEKVVYAQSVGLKLHMWFRLFHRDEDYFNLRSEDMKEARPVLISYHAMVKTLRDYVFDRMLDTQTPGVETYLFRRHAGTGAVCVLWNDGPQSRSVFLSPGGPARATLTDMYGNVSPLAAEPGGTLPVTVTQDPVFVTWNGSAPTSAARADQALIQAPAVMPCVHGADNRLLVRVRNPLSHSATFTLAVAAQGNITAQAAPDAARLHLRPGEARITRVDVHPAALAPGITWPTAWTVFVPAPPDIDLTQIHDIPASLPGAPAPRRLPMIRNAIDLTRYGFKPVERQPSYFFATVGSDADRTVTVGSASDWWMEWYVNGRRVFDTLATGNGGVMDITDHPFQLPLRKGRNLIACRLLSGLLGRKLMFGDSDAYARRASGSHDGLRLALTADGRPLSSRLVEIQMVSALAPLAPWTVQSGPADWEQTEPTALFDGGNLDNQFAKTLDSSRWYKGPDDLSATAWLRHEGDHLVVLAEVRDDTDVPDAPGPLEYADSLEIGLAPASGDTPTVLVVGRRGGQAVVETRDGKTISTAHASVERQGALTLYRVELSGAPISPDGFLVNLRVNDNDGYGPKQTLAWYPGLGDAPDTRQWYLASFR